MIHYIADDLGIHRDYYGVDTENAVTRPTWAERDTESMHALLSSLLASEARMDEWDQT